MKKLIENMEVKALVLRKKLKEILQTTEYLINDLNKLKASEEVNSED
jgi:hypothetical protein